MRLVFVLLAAFSIAGCQAWGNLTTGAMATTNDVAGAPPPARAVP